MAIVQNTGFIRKDRIGLNLECAGDNFERMRENDVIVIHITNICGGAEIKSLVTCLTDMSFDTWKRMDVDWNWRTLHSLM